jgi:hypothetical protein
MFNTTDKQGNNIPKDALKHDRGSGATLVAAIRGRFAPFGGVGLALPARDFSRKPPVFE